MTEDIISGKTALYGVIGDPIAHTFSPEIHNTILKALGIPAVYVPMRVRPHMLEAAVKGAFSLNIKGFNVTLPHKREIIKYLEKTDETAAKIGAVNTVKYTESGYVGYNTDVIGVERTFMQRNINLKGRSCLLIGAGGAADAICFCLLKNGVEKLYIANRTVSKAQELKAHMAKYFDAEIIPIKLDEVFKAENTSIVLNATTLGFEGKEELSPLPEEFFDKNNVEVCFDAIYSPWETRLLREADKRDILCINGFDMLFYQAAAAAEIWFERKFSGEFLNNIKKELTKLYKKKKEGQKNE